jgi:phosphate starvation-inducible PhoH-like protein
LITKKLHLYNDEEALLLLGEQDANLRQLEREFGVELFVRQEAHGLILSVRGSTSRVDKVQRRLKGMLTRIRGSEDSKGAAPILAEAPPPPKDAIFITSFGKVIRAKTDHQRHYVEQIAQKDLVFGIGPAGTGKTYLAVACALRALHAREVTKVVLTRPVVEAGEKLGFLPGDLYEKISPYLKPLYDAFYAMLGPEKFRLWRDDEIIEIVPLAYMRGRTLEGAFIILDEAQNSTPEQMKMFLTRMGLGSKIVVTGDVTQIDLDNKKASGLVIVQDILKNVEGATFIKFTEEDVVRHAMVKKVLSAYDKWEKR